MIYGVIALLTVQIILAALCGIAYLRTVAQRERFETALARITAAEKTADSALSIVQAMETSHFSSLVNKHTETRGEVGELASKVKAMDKEVTSLQMGILALQKHRKTEEKKAAAAAVEEELPPDATFEVPFIHNAPSGPTNGKAAHFGQKAR